MQKLKNLSIKSIIIGLSVINLLLVMVVIFSGYIQQKQIIVEQNNNNFEQTVNQMYLNSKSKCETYSDILEKIAYGQSVQNFLEVNTKENERALYQNMRSYLTDFMEIDDGICDIAILGENGRKVNLKGFIEQYDEEIVSEIPKNVLYYFSSVKQLKYDAVGKLPQNVVIVGAPIYSIKVFDTSKPVGTILIAVSAEKLMDVSLTEPDSQDRMGSLLLYDRNHELFFNSAAEKNLPDYSELFDQENQSRTVKIKLDSKLYYIKTSDIEYLDGKIVMLISEKKLLKDVDKMRQKQLWLLLGALLVESVLVWFLIRNITQPIYKFVEFFNRIEQGDIGSLKKKIEIDGFKEIKILEYNFNQMLAEINNLTHRLVSTTMNLYEMEMNKKQLEMEYLHSQINPHFLFNTMESIKGCAVTEDAWKTFKMLDALAALFRYTVRKESEVQVKDEIYLAKKYLFIQKMRFGGKLQFSCEVEEKILNFTMPKMILQPVVENAIVHGIEEVADGGAVSVKGWQEGDGVILEIANDGPNYDSGYLEKMAELLQKEPQGERHIGLYSVNKRLKYMYGERSGIQIKGKENGGIIVRMVMAAESSAGNPAEIRMDKEGEQSV